MARRVNLAAVLLLVVASQFIFLQLPPLVSSAGPKPPTTGSYSVTSPSSSKEFMMFFKKFVKMISRFGPVFDIVQMFLEDNGSDELPPSPPGDSSSGQPPLSPPPGNSSGPAEDFGLYYVNLQVGSPPQNVTAVVDISNNFVSMRCDPCSDCQTTPGSFFQRSASNSFYLLNCNSKECQNIFTTRRSCTRTNEACNYIAGHTHGYFVNDTFTFGKYAVPDMVFGCKLPNAMDNSGVSAVIGLGSGAHSLVSQLGISNFSYLLGPQGSIDLKLGNVTMPRTNTSRSTTTPLLRSKMNGNLYYCISLAGIRVDGQDLGGIPPRTFYGTGGMVLSTTAPITFLVEDAYWVLKQALIDRIPLQPVDTSNSQLGRGLDLCYAAQDWAGVKIPSLTLVFHGVDNVNVALELKTANYFIKFNYGIRDLVCLTVMPSRGASMLGSLMQTGTRMIYDLNSHQLTFVMEEEEDEKEEVASLSLAPSRAMAAWLASTMVPIAVWWQLQLF